jgi:hypothetical protein
MAKATIKSQSGAVITIEGSKDEVSSIIARYEQVNVVGHAKQAIARAKSANKVAKKRDSASDLIVGLKENGFFEKPKSLGDIATKLEEQGYLYAVTSLSGIVLGLVKKGHLRRKRLEGKWVYGK